MGLVDRTLRRLYNRWFRPDPVAVLVSRGLVVGKNLKVMEDVRIDWSHCWHISIGDDITLAPGVRILAHDASTKGHLGYTRIGKVEIGDRVFIGAGSVVLPGVRIGNDVVVGAASVVSRSVPDNAVVCGNPARPVSETGEWLERKRIELAAGPVFGEEYTVRGGCTPAMRHEMNERMADGIGYVV